MKELLLLLNMLVTSTVCLAQRALTLYPLSSQLGYRSNQQKKMFLDIKAGMTFSTLPFVQLAISGDKRWVNKEAVKMYSGLGITFDSFVPGVQFPIGVEFFPVERIDNLSVIIETNPKITFGPTNFLNTNIQGNIGLAYYFAKR
jgi:hypothetical protein